MRKVQITFDCPDDETYLQVLGISKSFKEQLSGLAEVEVKEVESPASDEWVAVEDGLPEYGEKVLVFGEHKNSNPSMGGAYHAIDYRSDLKGTSFEKDQRMIAHSIATHGFIRMAYVTHWRNFPSPPKK